MYTAKFSDFDRGTIYSMLMDAYSSAPAMQKKYQQDWADFDIFLFTNLEIMEYNGFVTVVEARPVGFISWDPRPLPDYIEIGHNCVVSGYKGRGIGKDQLRRGLDRIKPLNPQYIIARTGHTPFFLPARKMYSAAGFTAHRTVTRTDREMPTLVEFILQLQQ